MDSRDSSLEAVKLIVGIGLIAFAVSVGPLGAAGAIAAGVATGVGGNWSTDGLAVIWRRLKGASPSPDAALQRMAAQALTDAVKSLETQFRKAHPRLDSTVFTLLSESITSLTSYPIHPKFDATDPLQTQIAKKLDTFLYGHEEEAQDLLRSQLFPTALAHFQNALANTDAEWKRYHAWVLAEIHEMTKALQHGSSADREHFRHLEEVWRHESSMRAALKSAIDSVKTGVETVQHTQGLHTELLSSIQTTVNTLANRGTPHASPTRHSPQPSLTLVHISIPRLPARAGTDTGIDAHAREQALEQVRRQMQVLSPMLGKSDYLLLTGSPGAGSDGDYEQTKNWLDALCQSLEILPQQVLMVPGANDVDRGWVLDDEDTLDDHHRWRTDLKRFEALLKPEKVDKFRTNLWPKLKPYAAFADSYKQAAISPAVPFVVRPLYAGLGSFVFLGLNTTLLSFDGDPPGSLALGTPQATRSSDITMGSLVLVLMGHRLENLRDRSVFLEGMGTRARLLIQPAETVRCEGIRLSARGVEILPSVQGAQWRQVAESTHTLNLGAELLARLESLSDGTTGGSTRSQVPLVDQWRDHLMKTLDDNNYIQLWGIKLSDGVAKIPLEQVYVVLRASSLGATRDGLGRVFGKSDVNESGLLMGGQGEWGEPSGSGGGLTLHQALARSRKALLVGDPGSGKTTLLRFVAHKLAEAWLDPAKGSAEVRSLLNLSQDDPLPLPVLLPAARLNLWLTEKKLKREEIKAKNAREWLLSELNCDGVCCDEVLLQQQLDAGNWLLLIDGLDEVPGKAERLEVARAVRALVRAHKRMRVVMTSRTRAFEGALSSELVDLDRYTLEQMSQDEIHRFLQQWFAAAYPESATQARQKADELEAEIRRHEQVRLMALNPNILTLIALLKHKQAKLPDQRVELYRGVVALFLQGKDVDRGTTDEWERLGLNLVESEKELLLARLALTMHERGAGDVEGQKRQGARTVPEDVPLSSFEQQLIEARKCSKEQAPHVARNLLQWLEVRSGLLRRNDFGVEFSHFGYQEYLVAVALATQSRSDDDLLADVLKRMMDDWWNEPLRLLLALLAGRAETLLAALANAGEVGKGPFNWRRQGRGLALAMGAVRDIPSSFIPHSEGYVRKKLDGLLSPSSNAKATDRIEALEALGRVGDSRLGMEKADRWVPLPAATFTMGDKLYPENYQFTDLDGTKYKTRDIVTPEHPVTLTQPFSIGRYPVTYQEYASFVEEGGYRTRDWWGDDGWKWLQLKGQDFDRYFQSLIDTQKVQKNWRANFEPSPLPYFWDNARFNAPNQPVIGVSWWEARAYCRWLTAQLSQEKPAWWRVGMEVRLPTEAQWEYAARGIEGRRYAWGDAPEPDEESANFDSKVGRTTPVGAYPRGTTPTGISDMTGNVWEWCADVWNPKAYRRAKGGSPVLNPKEGIKNAHELLDVFLVRGGAWNGSPVLLRAAFRSWNGAGDRYANLGFRCVVVVAEPGRVP